MLPRRIQFFRLVHAHIAASGLEIELNAQLLAREGPK